MASAGDVAGQSTVHKRELLLHDGLTFIILVTISLALFGVTLFLFHSFESHRADLAVRWAERGQKALAEGHPEQAVAALRTALSYAPDERPDQLLLAQALASAGHTEEADNYFLNLWVSRPGDGFINLQLARLSRARKENKQAIDYYRASIFGSWEGDAIIRRQQVRLELSDFLIDQHQLSEARDELAVVAGNSSKEPHLNLLVAGRLQAAGDPQNALALYIKVLSVDPHNLQALEQAGQIAYKLGDYPRAQRLLQRAVDHKDHTPSSDLENLLANARRLQQLNLTRDQPAADRADHLLLAAKIAQDRLKACIAQMAPRPASQAPLPSPTQVPIALASLASRWSVANSSGRSRRALLNSAEAQDSWTLLIDQTELATAQTCGQPSGDDALLLKLARTTGSNPAPPAAIDEP